MLTKFRKGADNIFVRILLALIAVSFVGFGALSFLDGNSSGDIITFNKAKSVPYEVFLTIKARQIEQIQRQNNINLTEQQIKDLNIDHQILQSLINDSMIAYLANIYDLDISDVLVINFVKKNPYFQNDKGEFDLALFKAAFRNSTRQENEYLEELKKSLIKDSIVNIFASSVKPSKIMVENIVNYMAETKYFDIISVDLTQEKTDFQNDQISQNELENFYKKNEKDFITPELRSFDYILIGKDFFSKKIQISDEQIKTYYNENKNDFDNKPYNVARKNVQQVLFNSKFDELLSEFSKNLEEEVASGLNLKDIQSKYGLKISSIEKISKNDLANDEKLGISDITDSVFEMSENELSYPIEIGSQNQIILFEIKNIISSKKQEFAEIRDKIYNILHKKSIARKNMETLEEIRINYDPSKMSATVLKAKGFSIESSKSLTRMELQTNETINPELAYMIFNTEKNHVTNLVRDEKKAYFAFVKNAKIDKLKSKKITDNSLTPITRAITEGILQEMIGYLAEQNDIKVKHVRDNN